MKAIGLFLGTVLLLVPGCLVYGQAEFTGTAQLVLQFTPESPSMSNSQLEVRLFADLASVKAGGGANAILTSFSVPVGFDSSHVRLVSAAAGTANGYSSAGFSYTQPAIANGRGFVTLMNNRSSDQDPGTMVELGRMVFELQRPGTTSFIAGSARTIHQGTLAALPQSGGTDPGRVSWSDHQYDVNITAGASLPSLLAHSWFSYPGIFQGMALLNQGTGTASVQMFGWRPDGTLAQNTSYTNPSLPLDLPGLNQSASLTSQIFNIPDSVTIENGWIEVKANSPEVSGFFMQGVNTAQGETHQMDGINMTYSPASRLIFPLVRFSSPAPDIAISNPGSSAVDATIRIVGITGQVLRTVTAQIPAHGSFSQEINDATSESPVYVDVQAAGGGKLIGVERVGTEESIALLNGQDASLASNRLSGPQFASGLLGGLRMDTAIAIANPSSSPTTVVVRLLNESGQEIAAPVVQTMAAGSLLSMDGWKLFGLPDPRTTSKITVGTISVESDAGVIGAQSFGDPVGGAYLAALPLLSTSAASRDIFFRHVASGILGNVDYFTGVAMVNPSQAKTAHINAELHGSDGTILARTTTPFELGPGSRNAQLAWQLIPDFPATQFGGYLRLTSDIEIQAYMLIGDNYYNFLSAVP